MKNLKTIHYLLMLVQNKPFVLLFRVLCLAGCVSDAAFNFEIITRRVHEQTDVANYDHRQWRDEKQYVAKIDVNTFIHS